MSERLKVPMGLDVWVGPSTGSPTSHAPPHRFRASRFGSSRVRSKANRSPARRAFAIKFTLEVSVTPDVLPYDWKNARPIAVPGR